MEFKHESVLLEEAIENLKIKPGGRYIDATAGGGGHTAQILKRGGNVLAIDQDKDAVDFIKTKFGNKIIIELSNFAHLKKLAHKNNFLPVDGILFDLGLSSHQIEQSKRGFSFSRDEALDMRMGSEMELTAQDVVNNWSREELINILQKYGEEHRAVAIVDAIVGRRKEQEIRTTKELSTLIGQTVQRVGEIHPATRAFQAIRIAVNNELSSLREALAEAIEVLGKDGRIVVISFHSLEDRIVKQTFIKWERVGAGRLINKKPIVATYEELTRNRRARSAKLRIFEKKAS